MAGGRGCSAGMHHVLLGYDAQRSFAHVSVKAPGLGEQGQGYEASAVILFSCPSLNSSLAAARCEFLMRTIKFLTASEFVHTQQKPWREAKKENGELLQLVLGKLPAAGRLFPFHSSDV